MQKLLTPHIFSSKIGQIFLKIELYVNNDFGSLGYPGYCYKCYNHC